MSRIADLLNSAVELHRGGQLDQACRLYEQALEQDAADADALNLLGVALTQLGRAAEAVDFLRRAVAADSSQPSFFAHLGDAQLASGQPAAAIESFDAALRLDRDHVPALLALANIATGDAQLPAARQYYERVLQIEPSNANAHYCLGNVAQRQGQILQAIAHYRDAIRWQSDFAEARCNLGDTLRGQGQVQEALEHLERAVALRPDLAAVQNNLGIVLHHLGRFAESQQCYERAIAAEPSQPVYLNNLAGLRQAQGDSAAALDCYRRALAIAPLNAEARCGRGMVRLSQGELAEGWIDYEHRQRCPQFDTRKFPQPTWDGSPLENRTLLIHVEQGLGDTLQFGRYVSLAAQRVGTVWFAVQPQLIPLLKQSGFTHLVSIQDSLPEFDVHAPLLSLPRIFHTTLATIPAAAPYLAADPRLIQHWRSRLEAHAGYRIGIVWHGKDVWTQVHQRSVPLANFEPLARVPQVTLVSLQKGPGVEELPALKEELGVVDLGSAVDEAEGPFMDTAAIMKNLDLVVTCDTAAAHLAGGLGVPVWVALSSSAEWRWLKQRDDSPWYPGMRLFRQRQWGQWAEPLQRMAQELSLLVARLKTV